LVPGFIKMMEAIKKLAEDAEMLASFNNPGVFSGMLEDTKLITEVIGLAKKILIVDDVGMMRMMIKEILSKNGYEIAEARNAREAVEIYATLRPDLVTMDIVMPDLNGIDGVKAIRRIDPGASIIMCSAKSERDMVLEAIRAGAKGFIVKPFKAAQIVKTVAKVLEQGSRWK